jgi:RNA-binding protein
MKLTGKQKRYLRGLGNGLQPVLLLGKEGLSEAIAKEAVQALQAHELIKVKLQEKCEVGLDEATEFLTEQTGASLVQTMGRTALLYLRHPKNPKLNLPRTEENDN